MIHIATMHKKMCVTSPMLCEEEERYVAARAKNGGCHQLNDGGMEVFGPISNYCSDRLFETKPKNEKV